MNIKSKFITIIFSNLAIILSLCFLSSFVFLNSSKQVLKASDDVYYSGDVTKNNVSLMINVYWGDEYLNSMLETLRKHNVKATFFVGGVWVSRNPEMLIKIFEEGHEIANHGFNHKSHDKLSFKQNEDEILNNHKLVKKYLNIDMNLFMPPSGAYSKTTVDVAKKLGYKTIMWTKDTIDWRDQDIDIITKRVSTKNKNGDLILMHPTKSTSIALDGIITNILSQNFKIVCVSQNIFPNIVWFFYFILL